MFNPGTGVRMWRRAILAVAAIFAMSVPALPARAQDAPTIVATRVSATPERARLIIDLSGTTQFAVAFLDSPNRIAIDVKAGSLQTIAPQPVSGTGLVTAYTTSMAEEGRARTELMLAGPAVVQQAYVLDAVGDQPARLIVDLIPTTDLDFRARVAADLAKSLARSGGGDQAATTAVESAASAAPEMVTPEASSSAEPAPAPTKPAGENAVIAAGGKPLIVLDPGHGGVDNGATAPDGVHEKNITLTFALQLRDLLVATGLFDVALTRDDDTYLTLNERVSIARQNKADLFVSLHADTFAQADIRGASIYTRDERATDILDKILADGENRADIVAGYVQPDAKPAVVDLLVDLMRRQVRQQAYEAASAIVSAMQPSVALRRFPVRQADFFVLQAPDIPSLLIELGFLSNADDIANLESEDWRNKVVTAIVQGIEAYFRTERTAAQ